MNQNSETCETCGCTVLDCKTNAALSAQDYLVLVAVARDTAPGAAQSIHNVLNGWRSHVLPTCDALAIY